MDFITNETGETVKVLFVDDNDDTCTLITLLLGAAKIDVKVARTVNEVWEICKQHDIDLFLLDGQLEQENTLGLCHELRQYAPKTPILFYSGRVMKTDLEKGFAAGADDYLTKPYFGDLGGTVLNAIAAKEATPGNYKNN
jgi:CheY-like chemotaxis protein